MARLTITNTTTPKTFEYSNVRIELTDADKDITHITWETNFNDTGWNTLHNKLSVSVYGVGTQLTPQRFKVEMSGPVNNTIRWRAILFANGVEKGTIYTNTQYFTPLPLSINNTLDLYNEKDELVSDKTITSEYGEEITTVFHGGVTLYPSSVRQPDISDIKIGNPSWRLNAVTYLKGTQEFSPNDDKYTTVGPAEYTLTAAPYCQGWRSSVLISKPVTYVINPFVIGTNCKITKAPSGQLEWTAPREEYDIEWDYTTNALPEGCTFKQEEVGIKLYYPKTKEYVDLGRWDDENLRKINMFDYYDIDLTPIVNNTVKIHLYSKVKVYENGVELASEDVETVTEFESIKSTENLISRAHLQLNPLTVNASVEDEIEIHSDFIGTSSYKFFPKDMFTAGTYQWFWDDVPFDNPSDKFNGKVPFDGAETKNLSLRYTYINEEQFVSPQIIDVDDYSVITKVIKPMPAVVVDFKRRTIELEWSDPQTTITPEITGLLPDATITKYEWFTVPGNILGTTPTWDIKTDEVKSYTVTLKITVECDGYDTSEFYSRPLGIFINKKKLPSFSFDINMVDKAVIFSKIQANITHNHPDENAVFKGLTHVNNGLVFNTGLSFEINAREVGSNMVYVNGTMTSEFYEDVSAQRQKSFEVINQSFNVTAYIESPSIGFVGDLVDALVIFNEPLLPSTIITCIWSIDGNIETGYGTLPLARNILLSKAGDFNISCNVTLSAPGYDDFVFDITKIIDVSKLPVGESDTKYIHDLKPGRDRAYVWMGWWVHDEIQDALIENFDWVSDPNNDRFKYKTDIKTLAKAIKEFPEVEIQESRNGYILNKKDLT